MKILLYKIFLKNLKNTIDKYEIRFYNNKRTKQEGIYAGVVQW